MGPTKRPYGKHYATDEYGNPIRAVVPAGASPVRPSDARIQQAPSVCGSPAPSTQTEEDVANRAEKSSNMMSVLVIVSRITGFVRTSAQAWTLGLTGLASAYTVAAMMPTMLYELVVGGMLITAFLPVYVSVKKNLGRAGASTYASNLLSIVLILMGLLTIVSFICAAPIIWTQSAGAAEDFDFNLSVWFFRWFVCEIMLYALSSIISGVLNAERDYFWSNAAPILNNLITISSFALYGYLVNVVGIAWSDAVIVLAIGNPLGVAVQVFSQVPALARHGVRLRLHVDLRDPALRETVSIGLPTLAVTLASFPTTAVMSSCALSVTAAGASISYYARVWYVLPWSIFAIPLSVSLFTELSDYRAHGNRAEFITCFTGGMRKILFTLIPMMMFLIVFAPSLIAVFATGKFDGEAMGQTVHYLQALSLALPLYGLGSYLQKVCSAMMHMNFYAVSTCIAAVLQVVICLALTPRYGLYVVPISSAFYYGAIDLVTLVRLRRELGPFGMRSVVASTLRACLFGLLGSAVGFGIVWALTTFVGPCEGMVRGLLYALAGGVPAVLVTYGLAWALRLSDAPFFDAIFARVLRRAR